MSTRVCNSVLSLLLLSDACRAESGIIKDSAEWTNRDNGDSTADTIWLCSSRHLDGLGYDLGRRDTQQGGIAIDVIFGHRTSKWEVGQAITRTKVEVSNDCNVFSGNSKWDCRQDGSAVRDNTRLRSDESNPNGRPSSGVIVDPRRQASDVLSDRRFNFPHERQSALFDADVLLGNLLGPFTPWTNEPGGQEYAPTDSAHLAHGHERSGLVSTPINTVLKPLVIRPDSYRKIAFSPYDRGGEASSRKQRDDNRQQKKIQYVRINACETAGEDSRQDPDTGGFVFKAEWRDIDISYDGKNWFHLFGDFCVTGSLRSL